jgi:hypothetical protein
MASFSNIAVSLLHIAGATKILRTLQAICRDRTASSTTCRYETRITPSPPTTLPIPWLAALLRCHISKDPSSAGIFHVEGDWLLCHLSNLRKNPRRLSLTATLAPKLSARWGAWKPCLKGKSRGRRPAASRADGRLATRLSRWPQVIGTTRRSRRTSLVPCTASCRHMWDPVLGGAGMGGVSG